MQSSLVSSPRLDLLGRVDMTDIEKRRRPARIDEADVLAGLAAYTGEGLPSYPVFAD